ncbi:MAG: hypothetical protein AAGL24_18810, partial [Pseudomonadota bacterium]
ADLMNFASLFQCIDQIFCLAMQIQPSQILTGLLPLALFGWRDFVKGADHEISAMDAGARARRLGPSETKSPRTCIFDVCFRLAANRATRTLPSKIECSFGITASGLYQTHWSALNFLFV